MLAGFTKTASTLDNDARQINDLANEIRRARQIGEILAKVQQQHRDNPAGFKRWIAQNLDISLPTAKRYLVLHREGEAYERGGAIRLIEAYRALNIDHRPIDLDEENDA
jgi:hypothetical protein